MEKILNHSNENFITLIDKFISKNRSPDRNIADQVKSIIYDVEISGDKAINELTLKYDNYNIIYSTLVFFAILSNSVFAPLRIPSNVYYVKNMGANIFFLYVFNARVLFS